MPPLPFVNGVLKLTLKFTLASGTPMYTHMFMAYTGGAVTNAQLTTYAQTVFTNWGTNLKASQSTAVTLAEVDATDLSPAGIVPGVFTGSTPGTLAGVVATAETCVLLNLVIGRRYRGGHPRMYLPLGNGAVLQDPQHWTVAYRSSVATAWAAFYNSIVGLSGSNPTCTGQVNVSYHSGGVLRPTPVVDNVLAWNVNIIPASQRRRMGR